MVRGYERYYQKASRSTRDPRLARTRAWSPSLDMDALGLRAKWWRGPYEGPDGNNPSAPFRGADAPFQPPQEAIKLGNTTYADRVAAWAYSYDCALFEQALSVIFRNDTGLDFPGVGRTCNHKHLLAHMGKECKAGRCPKMRVAGAPVDSMLVALGIPCARGVGRQRGRRQLRGPLRDAFLTAVVSGVACLLFFRLYSDAIKQARRPLCHLRVDAFGRSPRRRRGGRVATPSKRESRRIRKRRQPEFFAGGPYRWYVAAVGAYFYCQLAVNFVVFAAFVDTRCKHHNILVVNRVDYTGLDFCALAGVEADASCGYGTATSPACDAGAQSLRPLRWAKKGAAFQGPTAWLGDSGWRQVFPWWLSVFF